MAAPALAPPLDDEIEHPEVWEALAKLELIDCDGEPMESDWHRDEVNLMIESVKWHFSDRTDFFVGGIMFIYFDVERVRNRNFRGPDFFYVSGRPLQPQRRWWALWQEAGRSPNTIVELISPTTEQEDRVTKFNVYEQSFRTPEYFLYDPDTQILEGFRMSSSRYMPLKPNEHGRLWSEELQLWIGTWRGTFHRNEATWLRFFRPDGQLVHTAQEAAERRADAAEAEVARLKAQMAQLQKPEETA